MTDLVSARRPFINGAWVAGGGGELEVASPATEEVVAIVETASPAQIEFAIAAARHASTTGRGPRCRGRTASRR